MAQRADSSHVERLARRGLVNPPPWMKANLMFEGITGSEAYGCRDPDSSDRDLVGICVPPKHVVFPHTAGYVPGFRTPEVFREWQQHHVADLERRVTYDFTIYSIVRFFELTAECNPNMIDNLFLPRRCVTKSSRLYEHLRDHRKLFLSTRVYHRFRGYANAQANKIRKKVAAENPRRQASIEKHGYDVKYGYHLVRLMLECEQVLATGDLRLDRDAATYNAIRNGEWSEERLMAWFEAKERAMEELHARAVVPERVDMDALQRLLLECLEIHFGGLSEVVSEAERDVRILNDLEELLAKYRG